MGQAVYVIVLGMALVFLSLTVVMLVTIVLERLFRLPAEKTAPCALDRGAQMAEEEEARIAAAIGAALAILALEAEAGVPAPRPETVFTLEQMSQAWKAAGRLEAVR
jgi:Na+-transporting methylmalonyl-CoA/oxaloacetate decarboxylase gamma subunit